jgi:spore coat protein CotH
MRLRLPLFAVALAVFVIVPMAPVGASTDPWPGPFEPTELTTFELQMSNADWDTIRRDTTNEIEVPATFQASGDASAITVSVRRKSSRALPSEADPQKVSMKVDINEFVDQKWRGLTKLSLENGSDVDPVSEGLAWNLHELAYEGGYYGGSVHPGLASWVRVRVNGQDLGVYVNIEERDKQFLKNRGLWFEDQTWLYEIDDIGGFELEEGDPHSPLYTALCYSPFQGAKKGGPCATPNDATLASTLPALIDMQAMLTEGAVDAFSSNGDALFTHGKNFRHVDFATPLALKRLYYPWDLDGAITNVDAHIYGRQSGRNRFTQTPYESVILNHPDFRVTYNSIMLGMTDPVTGPLSETNLHGFLDAVEPGLATALAEDPYQPIEATSHFASLHDWVSQRIAIVRSLAQANTPAPRPPYP